MKIYLGEQEKWIYHNIWQKTQVKRKYNQKKKDN